MRITRLRSRLGTKELSVGEASQLKLKSISRVLGRCEELKIADGKSIIDAIRNEIDAEEIQEMEEEVETLAPAGFATPAAASSSTSESASSRKWTDVVSSPSPVPASLSSISEHVNPWREAMLSKARPKYGLNLSFVPSVSNGDSFCVELNAEDVIPESADWKYALVGFVAGISPSISQLREFVAKNWPVESSPAVFKHSNGFYVFNFKSQADCDVVFNLSSWRFGNRQMVLYRWSPDLVLEKEAWKVLPLWVRFPGLPRAAWTEGTFTKIGSKLGSPVCTDDFTAKRNEGSFARVLIEMDITKPFPSEIEVALPDGVRFLQRIDYEWIPKYCTKCDCSGHSVQNCWSRVNVGKAEVSAPGELRLEPVPRKSTRVWVPKAHPLVEAEGPRSGSHVPLADAVEREEGKWQTVTKGFSGAAKFQKLQKLQQGFQQKLILENSKDVLAPDEEKEVVVDLDKPPDP